MPTQIVHSDRKSLDETSAKRTQSKGRSLAKLSRYYQTPQPCANRYLTMRWEDEIYRKHRQAVVAAKHLIDNAAPVIQIDRNINLDKLENTSYRLLNIEKENAILLAKMSYLYRNLSSHRPQKPTRNMDVIKNLGKLKLQREFIHITAENQAILEEIKATSTVYPRATFLRQYENWKKVVELNCRYPITWDKKGVPHHLPPLVPDTPYLQTLVTPLKPRNRRHLGNRRARPGAARQRAPRQAGPTFP